MTIQIKTKAENLKEGIDNLINNATLDYEGFQDKLHFSFENEKLRDSRLNEISQNFKNNFEIKHGKKYIKIINNGVFCFIVVDDFEKNGKQFKKGDVLKPANWNTPALNQPRGNVLNGNYPIQWTGPVYLK